MPIDSTPPAPKPKRAPAARPQVTTAAGIREAREAGLLGIGQLGTVALVARGQYADAGAVKIHWPNIARETAALAGQYDELGKIIDAIVGVGPFTAIIGAVLPFGMQLLANHGRIDPERAGVAGIEDPQDLEARTQAEVEKVRLVAKLAAAEQRRELDKMIQDLEKAANEGE